MPWLLAAIVTAGMVLAAIGLRGRVVARGVFCRRCRFDLGGHTPDAPEITCPECGRSTAETGRPRTVIRRRAWRCLVPGVLLLALVGGLAVLLTGPRGPAVLAALPEGGVLMAHRCGLDAAMDEIVARLGRSPPMSDRAWDDLIRRGLRHQQDAQTPWDPRWGDVLARAFMDGRMNARQIESYLTHGLKTEIRIRDRVLAHATEVGYWAEHTTGRINTSANIGVHTGLRLEQKIVQVGAGHAPSTGMHGGMFGVLSIPGLGGSGSGGHGSTIPIPENEWESGRAKVFIELRTELKGEDGSTIAALPPVRVERTVRRLPPGEPVVPVVRDAAAADAIRDRTSVSPIRLVGPKQPGDAPGPVQAGEFTFQFGPDRPRALAGRVSVLLPEREIEIGSLNLRPGPSMHGYGMHWTIRDGDITPDVEALIRAGRADVVFRTDPTTAERNPHIDAVLDVELVFRGVPIVTEEPTGRGLMADPLGDGTRPEGARPVED